tara:strand:+ start:907 stop:1176 length:270 start_codon:yes stop_codon:yes gene_type:complete
MTTEVNADEKYYEAFFDMFVTEGWKNLQAELTASRKTLNSLDTCKNDTELWTRQGQLNIVDNLLNFKTTIEFALEQLKLEDEENTDEDN